MYVLTTYICIYVITKPVNIYRTILQSWCSFFGKPDCPEVDIFCNLRYLISEQKMFESDDWDLDQDFLNDVDSRSSNIYSTMDNAELIPKRRKIEVSNDPIFSSNNNVDQCQEKSVNKTVSQEDDKMSRKNLILGMFNKKVPDKNIFQKLPENIDSVKSQSSGTYSCDYSQLTRKNVVLEILKKKNIKNKTVENSVKNLDSRKNELQIESDSGSCIQQQSNSNNDILRGSPSETSKKKLLEIKNKSSFKIPQAQANKKMALIRRFPGPAGLLPDDIDINVPISYLSSLDESDNSKESNETDLPEYCSQNTKNLFTEGAWQSMLDDLPDGFLKGSEIATVKQMASTNGYSCSKVDFLAGIVECIDHSHDNPPIVLKDFTDSIRGIVHRDIPLKYPGLLEANVVILLRDVGLLKTSGSFTSNKYHILISPSSLVAIYSNKGKIVCTRSMGSILGNDSNEKMKRDQKQTVEDEVFSKVVEEQLQKIMVHTSKNSSRELNTSENESINFDFANDFSFSASSSEITNTHSGKNFVSPTSKNLKDVEKENVQKQQSSKQAITNEKKKMQNEQRQNSGDLLNVLKRFSPNVDTVKKLSHNPRILRTNADGKESKTSRNSRYPEEMDIEEDNVTTCSVETESKVAKAKLHVSSSEKSKLPVRSRLKQFQNVDALTPCRTSESTSSSSLNTNCDTGQENKLIKKDSEFSVLCTSENDSDDEMLSQIDMDTIFSNAQLVEQ
ncbi:uncharacterized protein LOC143359012 [Halictus rubicundus]|uniref:uncharacterized protein LOC143359012 n=1 Tax=Halictus rubicundus TaxID=77578 RepID=UPI004036D8C4